MTTSSRVDRLGWGSMKFCPDCGSKRQDGARFCSNCGRRLVEEDSSARAGKVHLDWTRRRVPIGSLANLTAAETERFEEGIWVDADSPEAKMAGEPFELEVPPPDDLLVPPDCAWALAPYPGLLAQVPWGSARERFEQMGEIRGRTIDEVIAFVGSQPNVQSSWGGGMDLTWMKTGLFSGWTVSVRTDRYGVCFGFTDVMSL